eukprot:g26379.t1
MTDLSGSDCSDSEIVALTEELNQSGVPTEPGDIREFLKRSCRALKAMHRQEYVDEEVSLPNRDELLKTLREILTLCLDRLEADPQIVLDTLHCVFDTDNPYFESPQLEDQFHQTSWNATSRKRPHGGDIEESSIAADGDPNLDHWTRPGQDALSRELVTQFGGAGGFMRFLRLLNKKQDEKETTGYYRFSLARSFLLLLDFVNGVLQDERRRDIVLECARVSFPMLLDLTWTEIKDIEKESVFLFMDSMEERLHSVYGHERPDDVSDFIDDHVLRVAIKLLQCPFLDKRVTALYRITRLIHLLSYPMFHTDTFLTQEAASVRIGPRFGQGGGRGLATFLSENKILEILLGDNLHPQLLERS